MTDKLKMQNLPDNKEINSLLNLIYRSQLQYNKKIAQLQEDFDIVYKKMQNCYKELNYADLLHDTIIGSVWLKDKSFSLHGWAANYSFIYMLYRILDNVKPQHILEMGMGQSSRLTSQYAVNCNSRATLDIIENDDNWINTYRPQLAQGKNIKVHHCDLEFFKDEECECRKYKDLIKISAENKYDLIVVDGPWGGEQTLPRSNVLDLIENSNLADDFIIIFDDAERKGEQKTIANTLVLLEEKGIDYQTFKRNGIKTQQIITSATRSFVQYL